MGVVYRGFDPALDRAVAIKMVLDSGDGERGRERFVREARAAARLRHPAIVSVHEVGQDPRGRPFIVMDLVEGRPLDELFEAGKPLDPRRAATIVRGIAAALGHAHDEGIVHRDVKPQNVLVAADGDRPFLTDFGLARRIDGDATLTRTGQFIGTPQFAAPEQARGEDDVGPSADVWGVGAVLYAAITGTAPFPGATALEVVRRVIQDDPPPPRRHVPSVPRDLETITLRCLEKEPGRRYPSARAVAADLARFLAGEPIEARAIGRGERLLRWAVRNRALAATLAVSSVTFLILTVGGGILLGRSWAQTQRALEAATRDQARAVLAETAAREAERRALDEAAAARAAQADAVRQLAIAYRERGERLAENGELAEAWVTLAHAVALDDTPAARAALGRVSSRAPRRRWTTPSAFSGGGAAACRFVGDGSELLVISGPGWWSRWDVESLAQLSVVSGLSPRGGSTDLDAAATRVATNPHEFLAVAEVASGREIGRVKVPWRHVTASDLSSDGRTLAFGTRDGSVSAIGVDDWSERSRPGFHQGPVRAVAVSPRDALAIASGGQDGLVRLGETAIELAAPVTALAWEGGGRRLAIGTFDGRVLLWDPGAGAAPATAPGSDHGGEEVVELLFSEDGSVLVSGDADGAFRIRSLDGGAERSGRIDAEPPFAFALSPDGAMLATNRGPGDGAALWDVATGRERARIAEHGSYKLHLHPDGSRLLSRSLLGGSVVVIEASTGAELARTRLRSISDAAWVRTGSTWSVAIARSDGIDLLDGESLAPTRRLPLAPWTTHDLVGTTSDGRRLLVNLSRDVDGAKEHALGLLDVADGRVLWRRERTQLAKIIVQPGGDLGLIVDAGDPVGFDLETGEDRPVASIERRRRLEAAAFRPGSSWIAWGESGIGVRIHDASTGRLVQQRGEVVASLGGAMRFSADGGRLAIQTDDRRVTLIDSESGATMSLPASTGTDLALDPREGWVYRITSQNAIEAWDPGTTHRLPTDRRFEPEVFTGPAGPRFVWSDVWRAFAWDLDSRSAPRGFGPWGDEMVIDRFVSATLALYKPRRSFEDDRPWLLLEIETGRTVAELSGDTVIATDGRLVEREGAAIRAPDGARVPLEVGDLGPLRHAAFSRDGRYLGAAVKEQVAIWDTRTGARVLVVDAPGPVAGPVLVAPGGRHLAYGGGSGGVLLLDGVDGAHLATLPGEARFQQPYRFGPAGRLLAINERVWRVDDATAILEVRPLEASRSESLAFIGEGEAEAVAIISVEGVERIDLEVTRAPAASLVREAETATGLHLDADGRTVRAPTNRFVPVTD